MKARNKMIHFRANDDIDCKIDNLCCDIGRDNRSWLLNCLINYIDDCPNRRRDFIKSIKKMLPYLLLVFATYTNCLQCVNGYIDVPCDRCNGRGYTVIKFKDVPCRYCPDGLYDQRKISTGRKKIKCRSCKGKRKLKASAPQERNSRAGNDTTKAGISNPLASQQKKW